MEMLADSLQDYKDLVGNAALITTVCQFFAPAFICNDIRKQGNTENIPAMPFIGGLVIASLNFFYGVLLQDDIMVKVSVIGFILNVLYLTCYYYYTTSKMTTWLYIGLAGAFTSMIVMHILSEEPEAGKHKLGIIVTVFMMLLIASPLFSLGEIIRTKSTAGMPYPIIISGTVVTILWLLYGIIIRNDFIVFQNVIGLGLSVIQIGLMIIYPAKPVKDAKKKKKTN
ncbi:sugar transporter SWEET1 [Arctopsyche grandis]|uniref:sugar transporter SWEET1 n=1 Tax=Arctopsyche grandis TaxID=121162 RepID=UPI00406D8D2F